MSAQPSQEVLASPAITRRDRARFVKQARRRRAKEFDKLVSSLRHRLARLGCALAMLPALPRSAQGGAGQA